MSKFVPRPVRSAVESLSRNIVIKRKLPARFDRRPIYLSPANQLEVLKPGDGRFQKYLLGFADRFVSERSIVWDVGANMGIFAVPAAHRAKRGFVLAVEPDPFNQMLLHRTRALAENRDLRLEVLPAAVSDKVGIAELRVAVRGRSANSLAELREGSQMGGVRQHVTVFTVTLDWILERYPNPDLIKIDAEGAEALILSGGSSTLEKSRPIIEIEIGKEAADRCKNLFDRYDYVPFRAADKVDSGQSLTQIRDAWEVLAIPREKVESMIGA